MTVGRVLTFFWAVSIGAYLGAVSTIAGAGVATLVVGLVGVAAFGLLLAIHWYRHPPTFRRWQVI